MSEEYNNELVSVIDEDGKEHRFELLDTLDYEGKRYVALIPVYDDAEEIVDCDGELIILEVVFENGEDVLTAIEDDKVFDEVARQFEENLSDVYDFADDDDDDDDKE